MDRRRFLKTTSIALVGGTPFCNSAAAGFVGERNSDALLGDGQSEPIAGKTLVVAAVFPSEGWGISAQHMHFDQGCLSGLEADFPHEPMLDIRENKFAFDAANPPHLAIAVANPHDPESWRAAQTRCALVKRAGATLTLLFAAHPYPEYQYPFDPRTLTHKPEGGWMEGADVVINFVTLNLREEFTRMVYAMTHYEGNMPCIDLFDIRQGLGGGKQAMYFRDTACGRQRAELATRFARNQLGRSSLTRFQIKGGVVLMEVNSWDVNEPFEIYNQFANILPEKASLSIGTVNHYDIDPWMTVHTIVTYETT